MRRFFVIFLINLSEERPIKKQGVTSKLKSVSFNGLLMHHNEFYQQLHIVTNTTLGMPRVHGLCIQHV